MNIIFISVGLFNAISSNLSYHSTFRLFDLDFGGFYFLKVFDSLWVSSSLGENTCQPVGVDELCPFQNFIQTTESWKMIQ